eukprot:scaffold1416_cov142-Skeletonema_menzelii.AAC.1
MWLDLGLAAASSTSYVLNLCGDLNISTRSCRLSFTVGPDSREGHTSLLQDDLSRRGSYTLVGDLMRLDLAWPQAPHIVSSSNVAPAI